MRTTVMNFRVRQQDADYLRQQSEQRGISLWRLIADMISTYQEALAIGEDAEADVDDEDDDNGN